MTTLDEYRLHPNARSATIDRSGFLGDELTIRISCEDLRPESVEQIGLDVIKSIHVREEVDESRVDIYRGRPQVLTKTLKIRTQETAPLAICEEA
ncbi:MAG: hypothetical protein OXC31_05655 [Spirochaetaceae bacterium]|nr:hypothetical protein [Spirochaetaceae bacterium]